MRDIAFSGAVVVAIEDASPEPRHPKTTASSDSTTVSGADADDSDDDGLKGRR